MVCYSSKVWGRSRPRGQRVHTQGTLQFKSLGQVGPRGQRVHTQGVLQFKSLGQVGPRGQRVHTQGVLQFKGLGYVGPKHEGWQEFWHLLHCNTGQKETKLCINMNLYIFYDQMQYLRDLRFKSGYNQRVRSYGFGRQHYSISFPLQRKQISAMEINIHS